MTAIAMVSVINHNHLNGLVWFGFYGISTIVGYSMPNQFP